MGGISLLRKCARLDSDMPLDQVPLYGLLRVFGSLGRSSGMMHSRRITVTIIALSRAGLSEDGCRVRGSADMVQLYDFGKCAFAQVHWLRAKCLDLSWYTRSARVQPQPD